MDERWVTRLRASAIALAGLGIAVAAACGPSRPASVASPSPSDVVDVPLVAPTVAPTASPLPPATPSPSPAPVFRVQPPLTDAQKATSVYLKEVLLGWPSLPQVTWYEDPSIKTGTAYTVFDGKHFGVALRQGGAQIQLSRDFTVWHESGHVLAYSLALQGYDTQQVYLAYLKARGLPQVVVVQGMHDVLTQEQFADDFALSNLPGAGQMGAAEATYHVPFDRATMLAFYRSLFTVSSPVKAGPVAVPLIPPALGISIPTPTPATVRAADLGERGGD